MRNDPAPADVDRIRQWSPVDEDLDDVTPELRELFRQTRIVVGRAI